MRFSTRLGAFIGGLTILTAVSAPSAQARPDQTDTPDQTIAAALARIDAGTYTQADEALITSNPDVAAQVPNASEPAAVATGTDDTPVTFANNELAGGAAVALAGYPVTCGHWAYVDLTKKSYVGSTIFVWRHQVGYCRNGLEVKSWQYRTDLLTQSDGVVYFKGLASAWQSGLSTNRATSSRQRHIEFCVAQYGCYTNGYPWSQVTVFGAGGFTWESGGL